MLRTRKPPLEVAPTILAQRTRKKTNNTSHRPTRASAQRHFVMCIRSRRRNIIHRETTVNFDL